MPKKKKDMNLQLLPGLENLSNTKKLSPKASKNSDFFERFDTGTSLKLELFSGYTKSWFPVFFHLPNIKEIHIYDYFCGPGKDADGKLGSPLRTLEVLKDFYTAGSVPNHITTKVFFSDKKQKNVDALTKHLQAKVCPDCVDWKIARRSFEDSYPNHVPALSSQEIACLLIIDPFGLALEKKQFQDFLKHPYTDFLLFQPMSQIHRFCEQPGFTERFPGLNREKLSKSESAHQDICNYMLENWIPPSSEYYLKSFAIQKEKGQKHGVIFGSSNVLGIYKFIEQCWNQDSINGEANFAFAGDLDFSTQTCLIENFDGSLKVREFKQTLREGILSKELRTNKDIFFFALNKGFHPPSPYVKNELKAMKQEGLIEVDLRIPLSYKPVINEKKLKHIKVL